MSEQPTDAVIRRPPLVTAAVVLVYIGAVLAVVLGVLVVLGRYGATDAANRAAVTFIGIAIVLFGLFGISVASGLSRGSRLSQRLTSLFAVLQIVLYGVTALLDAHLGGTQIVGIVISAVVLVMLWVPRSRRWFRDAPRPTA